MTTTQTTSTTNIADLIHLLDQDTLEALSARLHKVAERNGSSGKCSDMSSDPGQLLFEFIDECLTAQEEYLDKSDADLEKAKAFLAEIKQETEE